MTLVHVFNEGFYNWFTLGVRKNNIFIHPFGPLIFSEEDVIEIINFVKR